MTRQIEHESSVTDRHQALIQKQKSPTTENKIRFGEVAGGTTAECAAICCCCPCGLMNLLILVIYKLPAGIFRKALKIRKKRKKKKKNKRLLGLKNSGPWTHNCDCSCYEAELQVQKKVDSSVVVVNESSSSSSSSSSSAENNKLSKEVLELEEEMWYRFHGAGFWRSPSQVSQRNM
ncbi:hypothetical protein BVC80_603g1 [Macleaya cordata]|uniref:Uncharacterized protein n=1 Tax=Macleaya cordata TaxID=56857 RepID=A0A200R0M8_MACCD|nr:hypothetical protein BVC80_603g1 [Macleaya cordata]